ncbi:hypothetical protein V492_04952 [Pseudogymnoascus sp. VKM F-4246]|nr:hypothetical protein V492_04952 [Pseudogymnoascus sp. VKM F-4246]
MAPATILDLPTELILLISTYLVYPSHIALRMTCQALRSTIPPLIKRPLPNGRLYRSHHCRPLYNSTLIYDMIDLLHIELWPCYTASSLTQEPSPGDYFACSYCLKMLPAVRFADNMITRWRGKSWDLKTPGSRADRICILCGVKQREDHCQIGTRSAAPGLIAEPWSVTGISIRNNCCSAVAEMARRSRSAAEGLESQD